MPQTFADYRARADGEKRADLSTLLYAFSNGEVGAVRDFCASGEIWDVLGGCPAQKLPQFVACAGFSQDDGVDEAIAVLLDEGLRSGRTGVFDVYEVVDGISYVEPIKTLIRNDHHISLAKFIANGFDPTAKFGARQLTAFEVADHFGCSAASEVMQAALARKTTNDLLAALPAAGAEWMP